MKHNLIKITIITSLSLVSLQADNITGTNNLVGTMPIPELPLINEVNVYGDDNNVISIDIGLGQSLIDYINILGNGNEVVNSLPAFVSNDNLIGTNNYLYNSSYINLLGNTNNVGSSYNSILLGNNISTSNSQLSTYIGNNILSANNEDSIFIGNGIVADGSDFAVSLGSYTLNDFNYSVAIGSYSETTSEYEVSVGNDTIKRRITNVADPISSYDAVNLNYLQSYYYTKTAIDVLLSGVGGSYDDTQVQNDITTLENDVIQNTNDISSLDNRVYTLENNVYTKQEIDTMFQEQDERNDERTALETALFNTRNSFENGNKSLAVGSGFIGNKHAIAIKYAYKNKQNMIFDIGVATTNQRKLYSASFSFSF